VLYFYPGDFTSGCTIEAKGFERDFQQYKDLGVDIVGVSVDSPEKHLDFGKSYGLEFPLLSDAGGVVSGKYGSLIDLGFVGKFSNRQTYIISPDHKIDYVFTDVEGSVAKHSENVLKVLKGSS
jgi:peroxiredoxin Q/BCP